MTPNRCTPPSPRSALTIIAALLTLAGQPARAQDEGATILDADSEIPSVFLFAPPVPEIDPARRAEPPPDPAPPEIEARIEALRSSLVAEFSEAADTEPDYRIPEPPAEALAPPAGGELEDRAYLAERVRPLAERAMRVER